MLLAVGKRYPYSAIGRPIEANIQINIFPHQIHIFLAECRISVHFCFTYLIIFPQSLSLFNYSTPTLTLSVIHIRIKNRGGNFNDCEYPVTKYPLTKFLNDFTLSTSDFFIICIAKKIFATCKPSLFTERTTSSEHTFWRATAADWHYQFRACLPTPNK